MRAVICGYYGMGNGGDEALLATLLQMLPTHIEPIVLSGDPNTTQREYQVEVCDRSDPVAVLAALRSAEAFIFGGGSLMQDSTSWVSPLYYGGLMWLAQRLRLKTVAWAQGIGPLQRPWIRWLSCNVFRGCTAVSVRDTRSANLLNRWQVSYQLAPDPVWALSAKPQQIPHEQDLPHPRIAVSLRPHATLTPTRLQLLIQAIADLQVRLAASIILIPFQPQTDRAIADQVYDRLQKPAVILQESNPQYLKGLFTAIDLTISMRLHGLIMAAAEGSNCYALSYDPKVTALMQDLNLPGSELSQLPTQPGTLVQELMQLVQACNSVYRDTLPLQEQAQQAVKHQKLLHQVLA
ncbi:MAG: polysaccharide pyruvyl transferase CsaB [Cyanobacteria bacterium P01_H01_bin.121]